MRKPISPHPGNVSTQVRPISFTTDRLMDETRLTAPTPMIAVVLACVVETGIPKIELNRIEIDAATSAEKPWYFSSFTMSIPTDLMIFLPPIEVPTAITMEHSAMIHTGICTDSALPLPFESITHSRITPMNF